MKYLQKLHDVPVHQLLILIHNFYVHKAIVHRYSKHKNTKSVEIIRWMTKEEWGRAVGMLLAGKSVQQVPIAILFCLFNVFLLINSLNN